MSRLESLPVPNRHLWNPDQCPEEMLGYLAWGLGVDVWDADWSEERRRENCRQAVALARMKGTPEAVFRGMWLAGLTEPLLCDGSWDLDGSVLLGNIPFCDGYEISTIGGFV